MWVIHHSDTDAVLLARPPTNMTSRPRCCRKMLSPEGRRIARVLEPFS